MKQAALGLAVSGFGSSLLATAQRPADNIIKDQGSQIPVMLGVILLQIKTQSEDSSLANYCRTTSTSSVVGRRPAAANWPGRPWSELLPSFTQAFRQGR